MEKIHVLAPDGKLILRRLLHRQVLKDLDHAVTRDILSGDDLHRSAPPSWACFWPHSTLGIRITCRLSRPR